MPLPPRNTLIATAARRALSASVVAFAAAAGSASANDLTQLSLEQLLDIKVTGASKYEQAQRDVAAAVSVITREDIRAFGWRSIDEALASLPGVHTTYDRQYNYLGTRGFSVLGDYGSRLLVTVNGNRLNDPVFDSGPSGGQLPLDIGLIERIEFTPGPGSAVHGPNAMFAVVNIVTRSGRDVGTEVAAQWKHPQATRAVRTSHGTRLEDGTDVLVSATSMRSRGEDHHYTFGASGISGTAAGLDGERDQELFLRAARGAWSFDVVWGDRDKSDPTSAYLTDPLSPGQFQRERYLVSQLAYQDTLDDGRMNLLARVHSGRHHYTSALRYGGNDFDTSTHGHWQGLELRLLSLALPAHKLMVGFDALRDSRVDQAIVERERPDNQAVMPGTNSRVGLYAQDEWQISPALTATTGLRIDNSARNNTRLSPRAALIWRASTASTVKALYGRGHRAPNAYERDYNDGQSQVGNPALRGERVDTAELVVDHREGEDLALRGSVYRWTVRDLIALGIDPVSGMTQYQSSGGIRARGVELGADKALPGRIRLRANLSLQNTERDGSGRLANSPAVLARLGATAPLPWWGLHAAYEWRCDSGRLTQDGSTLRSQSLSSLVLRTSALVRGLDLSLRVDNLFDQRYAHPAADGNWMNAIEQDGRSIALQATYRF